MSARKNKKAHGIILICLLLLLPLFAFSKTYVNDASTPSLMRDSIAKELGWVGNEASFCGGYYIDQPFIFPVKVEKEKENSIEITGNRALLAQHGTSILEGSVSATRYGQQLTSNKAFLYRNAAGKLIAMDMIGDVHLREPNTLVIAKQGLYNFETKTKSLINVIYRTSINSSKKIVGATQVTDEEMQRERKITDLTAWGSAYEFSQTQNNVYEFEKTSYSTCPPTHPNWEMKASHIELDKNTGRGYATNARLLVKDIPVFYTPYINFPIDSRRKSGFLWPSLGVSNSWGPYVLAPFYWNMAPNFDMTLTPGLLTKRGLQLTDNFRYLTTTSSGQINMSILLSDKAFSEFQLAERDAFSNSTNPTIQAELSRLLNSSTTRKAFSWRDTSQFDEHWSSRVDFNYAGDDYYLRNFGSNLNDISDNQLLQQGELNYKGQHWDFTGRLQTYQTLHPIDENPVQNIYRRFPQLILTGDYPDQPLGLEYFINNDLTHFDIRNTPGTLANQPIGNRFHVQPGVSLPLNLPYFYITPRIQLAFTDYNLYQTTPTQTPNSIQRTLPIFDIASGLAFSRFTTLFSHAFQQTLEPQVYYTYIPYRNQSSIPLFDTTVNTLSYDQLFNYNRFSGIDRIGDANQLGVGITTRLIDQESGIEKVRLGIGEIIYFTNRKITLCNNNTCTDNPTNPDNHRRLSPLSAVVDYHVNPHWSVSANPIWNPITKQLDNTTVGLHYGLDDQRVINFVYSYARGGDILSGVPLNNPSNNLKVTDASFAWPVLNAVTLVGRWSQNWNHRHLQNLLYGLQYDTCCVAVRLVGGRAFLGLDPTNNNKPLYNSQFYLQFSLKGLGDVGSGDPSGLLSSISGYKPQFGQEF